MTNKSLSIGLLITLVIAIYGVFSPKSSTSQPLFGGVTNYDEVDATAIKVGGSTGTRVGPIIVGTCTLTSNASIAATSTGTGTCATTGTLAGDIVVVSLATTTTNLNAQYSLIGTVAATDSTTVRLLNLTGVAAVPAATSGFGSSTQYQVFRTVSSVPGI